MLEIKASPHYYFLDVNKKYYQTYLEYNPTPELLEIVKSNECPDTIYSKNDMWTTVSYKNMKLPSQGWKIHVSANLENYKRILNIVSEMCIRRNITFKFSSDRFLFLRVNSKSTSRMLAGKYITIYPETEDVFLEFLETLYGSLRDFSGPFILSDRRYKDCQVLYYRYGSFIKQSELAFKGDRNAFLLSPKGDKILDNRAPYWNLPYWLTDRLYSEENAGNNEILLNGKYKVLKAFSFSNSGGNYLVEDMNSNKTYFMKEARENTSFNEGHDSTSRLENEYRKLVMLKGNEFSPNAIETFKEWEHTYLVEEFFEDMVDLGPYVINRTPLFKIRATPEDYIEYQDKLKDIWTQLSFFLLQVHNKGICYNDWSPFNVLVKKDTSKIKVIDYEGAYIPNVEIEVYVRTLGYIDKKSEKTNNFENEFRKIGFMFLFTILPVNSLYELDANKAFDILDKLKFDSAFSESYLNLIEDLLLGNINSAEQLLNRVEGLLSNQLSINHATGAYKGLVDFKQIVTSIVSSMSLEKNSYLFPADPMVGMTNPLNIAYGSLGILKVLYDNKQYLSKEQQKMVEKGIFWCLRKPMDMSDYTAGLFTGVGGIAWTFTELDNKAGSRLLKRFNEHYLLKDSYDLFYGLAGNALSNLFVYKNTNDNYFLSKAKEKAGEIMAAAYKSDSGYFWKDINGDTFKGYGRGSTGIALFFLYLYLETNDEQYLVFGEEALKFDMEQMYLFAPDQLTVDRGTVEDKNQPTSPYLYDGTAGIGIVALKYYQITNKNIYKEKLQYMLNDCLLEYTMFPSLMRGLAGIGHFLLDYFNVFENAEALTAARKIRNTIRMFEYIDDENISFPGEQLLRISHDFTTGTTGILTFLQRIEEKNYQSSQLFMLDEFYKELSLHKILQ